jgi:hypothetical protein
MRAWPREAETTAVQLTKVDPGRRVVFSPIGGAWLYCAPMRHFALASLLMMAACGGGSNPGVDGGGDDDTPDAAQGTPDADNAGWTMLIGRSWTIPEGVYDIYRCTRIQIDRDIYVQGFRSEAPLGSHHAVLTYATSNPGQLGDYNCNVNSLDFQHMVYASGVGTDDFMFPDDVAVRIPAGSFLNLNLHLFNAGDVEISGSSGVLIKELPAEPTTLADMMFAGDMSLSIPPGVPGHIEQGGCTLSREYNVVSLWPHMHQHATHQKLELTRGGTTTVLLDENYSFSDQKNWPQDPILNFQSGDELNVVCTYHNTSGSTVNWGDSSTEEMCFTGLYVYPAANFLFGCTNGF